MLVLCAGFGCRSGCCFVVLGGCLFVLVVCGLLLGVCYGCVFIAIEFWLLLGLRGLRGFERGLGFVLF